MKLLKKLKEKRIKRLLKKNQTRCRQKTNRIEIIKN